MKLLRSKKGFTLVEIIVVLVIIAILAAISLPALTGYIKDANEKAAISEARTIWVAMQTVSSTEIGKGNDENYVKGMFAGSTATGPNAIKKLTGMTSLKGITDVNVSPDGTVTKFTYDSNPKVYYYGGNLTITPETAP